MLREPLPAGLMPVLREIDVFKWLVVVAVIVVVSGLMSPGVARRLRLGRLPGDVRFTVRGRAFHFPFTTTILFTLVAWAALRIF